MSTDQGITEPMGFDLGILQRLIRLNAYAEKATDEIFKIAVKAADCKEVLRAHERYAVEVDDKSSHAAGAGNDPGGNTEADGESNGAAQSPAGSDLASLIKNGPGVRAVFRETPPLSDVDPPTLAALASIADVRPSSQGIPITRDSPFAYIASQVMNQGGPTTSNHFIQLFVRRLTDLHGKSPQLTAALHDAATLDTYRDLVNELDKWLDQAAMGVMPSESPGKDLDRLLRAHGQTDRDVLYDTPRICQIPAEFMRSFPIELSQREDESPRLGMDHLKRNQEQTQRILAVMLENHKSELDQAVQARLYAAQEFVSRRQFAKVQMLEFGWPRLGARVRSPGGWKRLLNLERFVREERSEREESRSFNLSPHWKEMLTDERLADFLSMPPYFIDIPTELLADIPDSPERVPAGEQEFSPEGRDQLEFTPYVDVQVTLSRPSEWTEADGDHERVQLDLALGATFVEHRLIDIPFREIRRLVAYLGHAYARSYERPADSDDRTESANLVAANPLPSPDQILEDLGSMLWQALASDRATQERLTSLIADDGRVRLVFTVKDGVVSGIPWECLYIPALRVFAGLTLKTSVIRNVLDPVSLVPRTMSRPVRILLVSSTPKNLPWINNKNEIELIRRILGPAARTGKVRVDVLEDPDERELQDRLRVFRPHIFHFTGHGAMQPNGEGIIALADEDKMAITVSALRFGEILREQEILLAILDSCFSGGESSYDMAQSVARVLVERGVPTAIATTREVLDLAATQFMREFYSALADGYPVEAAVVEARRLLRAKGQDWSAWVMYAVAESPLLELRLASTA